MGLTIGSGGGDDGLQSSNAVDPLFDITQQTYMPLVPTNPQTNPANVLRDPPNTPSDPSDALSEQTTAFSEPTVFFDPSNVFAKQNNPFCDPMNPISSQASTLDTATASMISDFPDSLILQNNSMVSDFLSTDLYVWPVEPCIR